MCSATEICFLSLWLGFTLQTGLPQLLSLFSAEHISMDVLVEMTHESLKDIGVSAYGHRHKILRGIKELQARIPERNKQKTTGTVVRVAPMTIVEFYIYLLSYFGNL